MRSKKAFYNIITSLVLQIIILICGFIVPKLIIRKFGSDVNGLTSSINQFLSYITLLESGIGPVVRSALYKPIAKKDNQEIKNILRASERFFRVIAIIFLVYLIALSLIYPFIVISEFSYLYTMSLVLIISMSIFCEYYFGMAYRLFLQASGETYIISAIQIVTYILNVIFIVVLIKLNVSIQIVKLVSCLTFVLRPIIQNIYVKKKYHINLKDASNDYKLEQKWNGLAQHIAAVIHNSTDITVLTIFSKLTEVSVYSVYHMVVKGIKSITTAFTNSIDSSFGDMIARDENDNLNKSFKVYELFYYTIATILYSCTIVLIIPFISVYTKDIADTNYIRPLFGYLIVISEFIYAIRLPYSLLTLAAGHFQQTKKGAYLEAILNIVISVVLVVKFGLIGVALGTLISILVRTIEFIYHANKYILKRSIKNTIKIISIMILEFIVIILISNVLSFITIDSYVSWFLYAICLFLVTCFIVVTTNYLIYKDQFKKVLKMFKRIKKS